MVRAIDRYELLRPLARGGMAEVYLARRRVAGLAKLLVIKRIRTERVGDPRFLELFVREARVSMSLTHQNIVPVFDFGRSGDQAFLVMERVEGRDLASGLERGGKLPPLVAAFVIAECCQALDYVHRRTGEDGTALGLVHRDVTPRNVLLSWSGEVKLTDFGVAWTAGDESTQLVGTPAYMAPEQARGEAVDARADVYSIGLVLREALTGRRAREGGDRESTLANARSGALAPWAPEDAPPDALRAIVARATQPAPAARFHDAREMLGALDEYLVAERAARRGDAPARQLATWLGPQHDERDDHLEGPVLEVIGTGAESSMLATVGDDPLPAPPPPPMPPPATATAPPRRRRLALAVGLAVVGATAIGVYVMRDPAPIVAPVDAAVVASAPPDASPDARIALDPIDAPRAIDAAPAPAPDAPSPKQVVTSPAIAAPTQRVTINALPWADFTIDGDPTPHQTIETVELPAGTHTLHFRNQQLGVTRDVVIEVLPDQPLKHVEDLRPAP